MPKATTLIALSVFALLILAYAHTCSLSVTWKNFSEDSGDLLAAAFTLGIPHPTGYPLYTLLARIFSIVMPGNIAFRMTLLSLLCASLAPVLVFLTAARFLPGKAGILGALVAALSLGFSFHSWSQAVVAEVYALHLLLTSIVIYLLVRWVRSHDPRQNPSSGHLSQLGSPRREGTHTNAPVSADFRSVGALRTQALFFTAAYVAGLSFTNHMLSSVTLVFAALLILCGPGRKRLSLSICFWASVFFLIPLTLYAYLPIRSLRDPHLDWGNPETWDQFWWVVTGAQYRFRLLGVPLAETVTRLWPGPFLASGWLVAALSAAGLIWGRLAAHLRGALAGLIGADLLVVLLYDIPDFEAYFLPAVLAISLLAAAGFARLVETSEVLLRRAGRPVFVRYGTWVIAGLLFFAAVLPAATNNKKRADASSDLYPYVFGRATFRVIEPDALVVSEYDGRTFALWFFRETVYRETHPRCIVVMKYLLVWPWYTESLRKLYPDLSVPEAGDMDATLVSLVASNLGRRPVYAVRDDPALRRLFRLKPVLGGLTPLFKVEPQAEPSAGKQSTE
jgi:hypothetical protein